MLEGFVPNSEETQAHVKTLAAAVYREQGNLEKSMQYLKDSYLIYATNDKSEETVPIGTILNSMGLVYTDLRKFERAEDSYLRSLKIRERLVGSAHPDTVAVRHNLAQLMVKWAKPIKAEEYIKLNLEALYKAEHGPEII